jgi:hypothetical protein
MKSARPLVDFPQVSAVIASAHGAVLGQTALLKSSKGNLKHFPVHHRYPKDHRFVRLPCFAWLSYNIKVNAVVVE